MRWGWLWAIALAFWGAGCTGPSPDGGGDRSSAYLPNSVGQIDEIVVVTDSSYWNGKLGTAIKKVLAEDFAVLPQPEPIFTLRYQPASELEGLFRKYRNILFLAPGEPGSRTKQLAQQTLDAKKLKNKFKGFHMFTANRVWAKPQQLTFLTAPSPDSLIRGLLRNGRTLIDHLHKFENREIRDQLSHRPKDQAIIDTLEFYHQVSLPVPKPYDIIISKPYFTWLRHVKEEKDLTILNLVIYSSPYNKQADFKIQNIIDRRDRFLGKFITGSGKGSYMMTDTIMPVAYKQLTLKDNYAIELKGLWRLRKEFMGGPFVSYSIYDTQYDRILTLEGFVYAPGKKKREFIREFSVLLRSLRILPPQQDTSSVTS